MTYDAGRGRERQGRRREVHGEPWARARARAARPRGGAARRRHLRAGHPADARAQADTRAAALGSRPRSALRAHRARSRRGGGDEGDVGRLPAGRAADVRDAGDAGVVRRRAVGAGVRWGELDYLIVDLPPGTADLQQHVFRTMGLAGALVVGGPQDAAHLDARKILSLLRDAGVPVLGGVENLRGFRCPSCGETHDVFPPVADERSLFRAVARLVSIPLAPALGSAPFDALAVQVEE